MKVEVSSETLEALAIISKAAGGTGAVHVTTARICDNCEDDHKEAFPYCVHDKTGKYWEDLCNECFDLLMLGHPALEESNMTQNLPTLTLYQWYTIRHGLHLIMQQLLDAEDPDGAEKLECQRIAECAYTQNLQATIQHIIDTREKELGLTPMQGPHRYDHPTHQ